MTVRRIALIVLVCGLICPSLLAQDSVIVATPEAVQAVKQSSDAGDADLLAKIEALAARVAALENASPVEPVPTVVLSGLDDGQIVSGKIIVVADVPDEDIESVEFAIDGERVRIERMRPYSLGSDGGVDDIRPWDSTSVDNGPHTLAIAVTLDDGRELTRSIGFEVSNDTPTPVDPPSDGFWRDARVINLGPGSHDVASQIPTSGSHKLHFVGDGAATVVSTSGRIGKDVHVRISNATVRPRWHGKGGRIRWDNVRFVGGGASWPMHDFGLKEIYDSEIDNVQFVFHDPNNSARFVGRNVKVGRALEDLIKTTGVYHNITAESVGVGAPEGAHPDVVQLNGEIEIDGLTVEKLSGQGIIGGLRGSIRNVALPVSTSPYHAGMQLTNPSGPLIVENVKTGGALRFRYDENFRVDDKIEFRNCEFAGERVNRVLNRP